MPGTKLECPSCGLTLTMPKPVSAGALLRCPKCQASFGVPAVESAVPMAAPAIARPAQAPVTVAVAATTSFTAEPSCMNGRIKQPQESGFPELETFSPAESTQLRHKGSERSSRRGQRTKPNNARTLVLCATGGLIVIGGLVAIVVASLNGDDKKPGAAKDGTDLNRYIGAAESKPHANIDAAKTKETATSKPDKKGRVVAKSRNGTDKKKAADAKTDKVSDMAPDPDPNAPIPIPGVQTPLPKK